MSAAILRPLTRRMADGTPYTRMPQVEQQLLELAVLPFDEVATRCALESASHPDFVRPESLTYLLRQTRGDNSEARFNRLFPLFLRRILLAMPRAEVGAGDTIQLDGPTADANEVALHRVMTLVTIDRDGGDQLDFYKVHFAEAIAMLRSKARLKVAARVKRETPLAPDPDTNELPVAVEQAAERHAGGRENFLFDPIFRPRLLAAIDALPHEQKEVVTMTIANIPGQSDDPATPSISRILNCDPRTVHNRRVRAVAALRRALGLGDGA